VMRPETRSAVKIDRAVPSVGVRSKKTVSELSTEIELAFVYRESFNAKLKYMAYFFDIYVK